MRSHCEILWAAASEFGKAKWHGRLFEHLMTRAISLNIFATLIFDPATEFGVIVMKLIFTRSPPLGNPGGMSILHIRYHGTLDLE